MNVGLIVFEIFNKARRIIHVGNVADEKEQHIQFLFEFGVFGNFTETPFQFFQFLFGSFVIVRFNFDGLNDFFRFTVA